MTLLPAQSAAQNPAAAAPQSGVERLAARPDVGRAFEWLGRNAEWITEQHVRINEVPAPPFQERARGLLMKRLLDAAGLKVRVDELGNVTGVLPGTAARGARGERDVVLIVAHLDTVFPAGTDVRVKRTGTRLEGAGVSDNAGGLAAILAVAEALRAARIRPQTDIVFAADVGEEGEGNLRGMRKLMETYRGRVRAVIAVDGASTEHITSQALASRRFEIAITGPGGHSWADFGMPNPIHALSRGLARFVRVRVPASPRTTFNVGVIEGGTSVNSIPYRSSVKVDLRSESEAEIEKLEAALREALQSGVSEEMADARERATPSRGNNNGLELKVKLIGSRPGGELPENSPLLAAMKSVDKFLGNRSHTERSSTDANIPLSMGVPAIAIGGGGRGGGAHSLGEWYDAAGRELGLKRLLLITLLTAGLTD
jgi:acetylornithine deacetylase/succinyl-diaminopimelate desuccinylase-like protein